MPCGSQSAVISSIIVCSWRAGIGISPLMSTARLMVLLSLIATTSEQSVATRPIVNSTQARRDAARKTRGSRRAMPVRGQAAFQIDLAEFPGRHGDSARRAEDMLPGGRHCRRAGRSAIDPHDAELRDPGLERRTLHA